MASNYSNDITASNYSTVIGALNGDQKIGFYTSLAHRLTVVQRVVWSDESLSPAEQIARMKHVNEIMHGVLNRLHALRFKPEYICEDDLWEQVKYHVRAQQGIAGDIGWAIKASYAFIAHRDLANPICDATDEEKPAT